MLVVFQIAIPIALISLVLYLGFGVVYSFTDNLVTGILSIVSYIAMWISLIAIGIGAIYTIMKLLEVIG